MTWSTKCGGECCKAFTLSVPWSDLVADFEEWKRGERGRFRDVWLMIQIFKPLGMFTAHPSKLCVYDRPTELFTCTMLGDDGLCTIYDQRPWLCHHYPGESRCGFAGCRSEAAQQFPFEMEA